MPNHVSHKMMFINEAAKTLFMEMKTVSKDSEVLDFDYFIPTKKPWDYDDAISKHGTKWGAYQQKAMEDKGNVSLYFDTAWSTAVPVWEEIADKYPDVDIIIYYADEDTGQNLGVVHIMDGDVDFNECSNSSDVVKIEILNMVHEGVIHSVCGKCGYIRNDQYSCECEYEEEGGI